MAVVTDKTKTGPSGAGFPAPVNNEDYEILSVQPSGPPPDMTGTDWHCYLITQGRNRICGYRQGNLESVTRVVEEIVMRLNERRVGKRGRVHLDMSSGSKAGKRK